MNSSKGHARSFRAFTVALAVFAICASVSVLGAQGPPEIERFATAIAAVAAKSHPQHILLAMREGCLLEPEICAGFESSLRAELLKLLPGVQFADRDSTVKVLRERGFLTIDAYDQGALRLVGVETKADLLVLDNLLWRRDGYELTTEAREVAKDRPLTDFRKFKAKVPRSVPDADENPFLFPDPESGAVLIIYRGKPPRQFRYPACDSCPNPPSLGIPGVVALLGTVTDQGSLESVFVTQSENSRLTAKALEVIRSWRFKPGIGVDGKPFAARVPIEVTFQ